MSNLVDFNPNGLLSLVVGWQLGRNVHARHVNVGGSVMRTLREYAISNAEKLDAPGGRDYNPDDDQGDSPFLRVPNDELVDDAFMERVLQGGSLPSAHVAELRKLKFYAVLIGNDDQNRTVFVRRGTPVQLATKGLVALFRDGLNQVSDPVFAFDRQFDVIVSRTGFWALNQKNFEAIFKDTETVLAKTSEWVDELSQVIPIESGGKAYLAERIKENSILRRKVQAIVRKPHIASLKTEDLRNAIEKHGLNEDALMSKGELVFSSETEKEILQMLNEDLFRGDFSGDAYAASKKSPRGS